MKDDMHAAFCWYSSICVTKYISLKLFIVSYLSIKSIWYFSDTFMIFLWGSGITGFYLLLKWYWFLFLDENQSNCLKWSKCWLSSIDWVDAAWYYILSDYFLYPVLIFSGLNLVFNYSEMVSDISHSYPKSLSKLLSSLLTGYNLGWGCLFLVGVGAWGSSQYLVHV